MSTQERHHIGLIGSGIDTSMSPSLHNSEASRLGLADYSYDLIELDPRADPGQVLRDKIDSGYTGFNVTHPFKRSIVASLDDLSHDARMLGAVNTVAVRDGRSVGFNTDHTGFLTALGDGLPSVPLDCVTLIGAGGAGSAVAFALATAGVRDLRICDVNEHRARDLSEQITRVAPATSVTTSSPDSIEATLSTSDGVVNASPIGMVGHPGTPFPVSALRASMWVADIVYRPLRTDILAAAMAVGSPVLDGGRMVVGQAADAFVLLTGTTPDRERMRLSFIESIAALSIEA
ncbi:MAG: shikimate dehydrogenase [Rhodococcus sp. (in: high G+C Gram-positive bacteria)]